LPFQTDKLQNSFKGDGVKYLGLALLVMSTSAMSVDQTYPAALINESQYSICHPEDQSLVPLLAEKMHDYVLKKFEAEAKAANLSLEDYLNKKQTHDAFLVQLREADPQKTLETHGQAGYMLHSFEMGFRFQILATVRFPSLSMIDAASEVLQNQWLPIVEEISNDPKGCDSAPQVNSSQRESSSEKPGQSGPSSPAPAPGAVSR
jgi:hypothetical protein